MTFRGFVISICGAVIIPMIHGCARSQQIELKVTKGDKKIILSLTELKTHYGAKLLEVSDPNFKKRMVYQVIPLATLISDLQPQNAWDEIVFRCQDGYAPSVSREKFQKGFLNDFYLAFAEKGEDTFVSWFDSGKKKLNPGPFYIVTGKTDGYKILSWPYQVVEIEFSNFHSLYGRAYPSQINKTSKIYNGFLLFKDNCIKCHSVNLQGGDIGPELNQPLNITEYRSRDILRKFIRNTGDFRARSKMPSFMHLSEKEVEHILTYLAYMKNYR